MKFSTQAVLSIGVLQHHFYLQKQYYEVMGSSTENEGRSHHRNSFPTQRISLLSNNPRLPPPFVMVASSSDREGHHESMTKERQQLINQDSDERRNRDEVNKEEGPHPLRGSGYKLEETSHSAADSSDYVGSSSLEEEEEDGFLGILSTGGMATYEVESESGFEHSQREHHQRRSLANLDFPVRNTSFSWADQYDDRNNHNNNSTTEVGRYTQYLMNYLCSNTTADYCDCDFDSVPCGTPWITSVVCEFTDYCTEYKSKCGQPSTECFDFRQSWRFEALYDDDGLGYGNNYTTFVRSACIHYFIPERMVFCFEGRMENNVIKSCKGSFNGVECQSCKARPDDYCDFLYSSGEPLTERCERLWNGTESSRWCYEIDCYNTDIEYGFDTCSFGPGDGPMWYDVHFTAGCADPCMIYDDYNIACTKLDESVELETYKVNGSMNCIGLMEMAARGYFSIEECAQLKTYVPAKCGCPVTISSSTDEPSSSPSSSPSSVTIPIEDDDDDEKANETATSNSRSMYFHYHARWDDLKI